MKKIPLYSLVIFPTENQIELISSWKKKLQNKTRAFKSSNSKAHVTVAQFENELSLLLYIDEVKIFCANLERQIVIFNSFNHFNHFTNTFYIAPDSNSKIFLDKLIYDLNTFIGYKINRGTINSHMSIGRQLTNEELITAYNLFADVKVDLQFICNTLHLRKYNKKTKQYSDLIEKISFGN